MLIVISPAKTLDFETEASLEKFTQATFLDKSQALIDELKQFIDSGCRIINEIKR